MHAMLISMGTIGGFDPLLLIRTVFQPKPGERVGVFIDLPAPADVVGQKFMQNPTVTQRIAYEVFYQKLLERKAELSFASVEFFAYTPTGGSNLDLPPQVTNTDGKSLRLCNHKRFSLMTLTASGFIPLGNLRVTSRVLVSC